MDFFRRLINRGGGGGGGDESPSASQRPVADADRPETAEFRRSDRESQSAKTCTWADDGSDDERNLQALWTQLKTADNRANLSAFMATFIHRYREVTGDAVATSHPSDMIARIARTVNSSHPQIVQALRTGDVAELTHFVDLFHVLAILSRFPKNKSALRKQDVVGTVLAIMRVCSEELSRQAMSNDSMVTVAAAVPLPPSRPQSVAVMTSPLSPSAPVPPVVVDAAPPPPPPPPSADRMETGAAAAVPEAASEVETGALPRICAVLGCAAEFVAHFHAEAHARWGRPSDEHREGSEVADGPIVDAVIEGLRAAAALQRSPHMLRPSVCAVHEALLATAIALVQRYPGAREQLRPLLPLLKSALGPPALPVPDGEAALRHLSVQLVGLQLVRVLLVGSVANAREAEALSLWDSVVAAVWWAAACFPAPAITEPETHTARVPRALIGSAALPSPAVMAAAAAAGAAVAAAQTPGGAAAAEGADAVGLLPPAARALGTGLDEPFGEFEHELQRRMLRGRLPSTPRPLPAPRVPQCDPRSPLARLMAELLAMCTAHPQRSPACPLQEPALRIVGKVVTRPAGMVSVPLKFAVLDLVERAVQVAPLTVAVASATGLWDALLGDGMWAAEAGATGPEARVRSALLALFGYVGTLPDTDNAAIVRAVLNAITVRAASAESTILLYELLLSLLRHAAPATLRSLQDSNALATLAQSAVAHGAWADSPAPLERRALAADVGFLDALLSVTGIHPVAVAHSQLLAALFALLERPALAHFALQRILLLMEAAVSVKLEQRKDLYTRYLESLPRIMSDVTKGSQWHFHLLFDMLTGVRSLLQRNTREHQRTLRETGSFTYIVDLLNAEHPFDKATLCEQVLHTLTALMAHHASNKAFFHSSTGYDQLASLILNNVNPITGHLFDILLDMLVDGQFSMESRYLIRNPDVVRLIFMLFEHCPLELQTTVIARFTQLAQVCARNREHLCGVRTLERLLRILQSSVDPQLTERLLELVQVLGSHSVSVRELKGLFRMLRSEGGFKAKLLRPLLGVVENMAKKTGPNFFFDFDGFRSHLELPPISWPGRDGYSFATWLRVESFSSPRKLSRYQPRIFSLFSHAGWGVDVILEGGRLFMNVVNTKLKTSERVFDQFTFNEKCWYHVALTQTPARLPWAASEVRLYVNGVERGMIPMTYPHFEEPLTICRIGASSSPLSGGTSGGSAGGSTAAMEGAFFGQMGAIYFFNQALPAAQIRSVYLLGPTYKATFQPTDAQPVPPALNTLTDRIFLTYNSLCTEGKLALDNSPESTIPQEPRNARMRAVHLCLTASVKGALHCVGGIRVLFPLFAQLDEPYQPADGAPTNYDADPAMCLQLLSLLHDLLLMHPGNLESMHNRNGFGVVSFLLQRSPRHLTVEAVRRCVALLSCVRSVEGRPGIPDNLVSGLTSDLCLRLLLDWRLWTYTPFEVQMALLEQLLELATREPELFREKLPFGIQEWVDLVRQFFWFEPDAHSFGQQPITHRVTKEVVSKRCEEAQLVQLRAAALRVMTVLANPALSLDDTRAITQFLADCTDDRQLVDMLQFVQALIIAQKAGFWIHLELLGGLDVFLALLDRPTEAVRVLAMKCIGLLLAYSPKARRSQSGTLISKNGFESITAFPFSEDTFNTLMMVLLEDVPAEGRQVDLDDEQRFQHPGMLNTIFAILPSASLFFKQKVMQDIILLVSNSPHNRSAMLGQTGWQTWLYTMLVETHHPHEQPSPECEVVFELVMTLFKLLLYHTFKYDEAGFKVIEETLGLLELFDRKDELDVPFINRHIFASLLSCLQSELIHQSRLRQGAALSQFFWIEYFAQSKAVPVLSNLVHVLNLIEDFLFYAPLFALRGPALDPGAAMNASALSASGAPDLLAATTAAAASAAAGPAAAASAAGGASVADGQSPLPLSPLPPSPAAVETRLPDSPALRSNTPLSVGSGSVSGAASLSTAAAVAAAAASGGAAAAAALLRGEMNQSSPAELGLSPVSPRDRVSSDDLGSPLMGESERVQITLHRLPDGTWADLSLVEVVLQTLDMLGFTTMPDFSQMEQLILEGKIFIVMTNLRSGGVPRIVLRLIISALIEGDRVTCTNNVKRLLLFLRNYLDDSGDASDNRRLFSILAVLIRAIRESVGRQQRGGFATHELIAPVLRVLLRRRRALLANHLKYDGQPLLQPEPSWLHDSAPIAAVVEEVLSPAWQQAAERVLDPEADAIEAEEAEFAHKVSVKWQRFLRELYARSMRSREERSAAMGALRAAAEETVRRLRALEAARMELVQRKYAETTRASALAWRHILRSVTNERGAWGVEQSAGEQRWKLDKTEDASRRRMRLRRNYDFDPHVGCAANAHDGSSVETAPQPPLQTRRLKLAALGTAAADVDEFAAAVEVAAAAADDQQAAAAAAAPVAGPKKEVSVHKVDCDMITPLLVVHGALEITTTHIYFRVAPEQEDSQAQQKGKDRKWPLSKLQELHFRRYILRRTALELFFVDKTNYFLTFANKRERDIVFQRIVAQQPPNLAYVGQRTPAELLEKSALTERWQRRQISNFDYLMQLNTLAGRTYNDLTQYPVFPWVLADYTSDTLDLSDPSVYRDLSRPVGALNLARLDKRRQMYEEFEDPEGNTPKFHHGTHYSTAGYVLFYLVRLEPFTTHFLTLQGGHFDHADRMFFSIAQTWHNCLHGSGDVKELIPEFFYMPEFLVNHNETYFGKRQAGVPMNDVILPPWAKNAHEFVRINREALESEYVSEHLHEWIDLIFGYKQQGPEAVAANNVFHHLTYEDSIPWDQLTDPQELKATQLQINEYGQTPSQLLTRPHPKRLPLEIDRRSLFPPAPQMQPIRTHKVTLGPADGIVHVAIIRDRLVTVSASRCVSVHKFLPTTPDGELPFTLDIERSAAGGTGPRRRLAGSPAHDTPPRADLFVCTRDGRFILTAGNWDHSLKVTSLESGKLLQSVGAHKDVVTCVAMSYDNTRVVTGSKDATLMVWDFTGNSREPVDMQPLHVLIGHDDEVTCVAVDAGADIVVSGARDGTCILHTLRTGNYVRTIPYPRQEGARRAVHLVAVNSNGHVLMYSRDDLMLHLFSVNGELLASAYVAERLHSMTITRDGEYIVTGGELRNLIIREMYTLRVVSRLTDGVGAILSVTVGDRMRFIFGGTADGRLLVFAQRGMPSADSVLRLPLPTLRNEPRSGLMST